MSFYFTERNGLPIMVSDLLENAGATHAFSCRKGGVSESPHLSSLNLGADRGDKPENVSENRRRFAAALNLTPERVVFARQIHSGLVRTVDYGNAGNYFECDGFTVSVPGLGCAVKIADCVPILLYEPNANAAAALHAGWRGSAERIAGVGVKKLLENGGRAENIIAAIGPCIHFCCYEVDEAFFEAVSAKLGQALAEKFIKSSDAGGNPFPSGHYHADLPGLNRELLLSAGLKAENIDVCPRCTCCEPELFFSHRASGGKRGVQAAGITIKKA